MPLGTLTAQTILFEPRKPGVYQRAGLAIGAPSDEFRITSASPSSKSKVLSMSFTRVRAKDFTPAGSTVPKRVSAIATVNIQIPNDGSFTSIEADSLVMDLNEIITAALLTRVASGEN